MLSFDMKNKLNTLRDILVGKVPDPKSQVEQITIAMVFKFMDDMDKEFLEDEFFGGERKFFVDTDKVKYSKYSWSNIMNPQVSGQERADLYREGVEAMQHNPNLPDFFKDVFRNAYIPFRDSETINLFLKEINEFTYNSQNSEDLGEAYEMLLSIMSSQGEAGQFRTPRHIIDMIVDIVQPSKNDRILDPACGTAGFLISAYKHILNQNLNEDGRITLTPDDKARMMKNFEGYDISQDMVRLSRVNMYLHHFSKPKIYEYDTLTSQDRWDDQYDVIFANPPFMTPKGGINPHNRFRVQANRSEILFVDYIVEHLAPNGRSGIIVPEGIVFQSSTAYKNLRKYLVDDGLLYAVVSMPTGVFNPYSGVKTSVLLIDKDLAKRKDEILFVKMESDGFDLGAQRKPIRDNDIPFIIETLRAFQNDKDVNLSPLITLASKTQIAAKDYVLVGERYKESVELPYSQYPIVELSEICEISRGTSITQKDVIDGCIPVIAGGQQPAYYHNVSNRQGKTITVSGSGAYAGFVNYFEEPIFASDCSTIQANNPNANITYVYYCLKATQEKIYELQTGMGQPHVYAKDLKKIKIPLPPLVIQEKLVSEIKQFQKIIDGAKLIIDNYKPIIKVVSSWDIVKLSEICDLQAGGTPLKSNQELWDSNDYAWYTSGELNETYTTEPLNFISEKGLRNSSARLFPKGSLLVGMYDTAAFKMSILDRDATFNQAVCGIKPSEKINMLYLLLYFSSQKEKYLSMRVGARQRNLTKQFISDLEIALPPIEVQEQIVDQISEELIIVEKNKHLIEIFEEKIKEKINEIWDSEQKADNLVQISQIEQGLQFAARNCSDKFVEAILDKKDGDSDE